MAMSSLHRQAIVRAAVALFRKQGFAATGINDILARSGAPKGSLYHYFPGGKAELGEAAVRAAGETVTRTLSGLRDETPVAAQMIRRYVDLVATWMTKSRWRDGCPIATTLLETASDLEAVASAGREAFADWAAVLGEALESDGVDADRAHRLGRFAISAVEGALVQAKVERSDRALLEARDELAALMAEAAAKSAAARSR